ncbi:DUF6053 domain-containing protein [Lysobacter enzymogenes]|uniref:DUF6053 domain-containing protein n=1 Tax=Lysobacter enzymogenes TaxID=69 RepID=UPI003CCDDE7E
MRVCACWCACCRACCISTSGRARHGEGARRGRPGRQAKASTSVRLDNVRAGPRGEAPERASGAAFRRLWALREQPWIVLPEARWVVVGGPSSPMLLFQIAATWPESVGPEGPPTTAWSIGLEASRQGRSPGRKKAARARRAALVSRGEAPIRKCRRILPTAPDLRCRSRCRSASAPDPRP